MAKTIQQALIDEVLYPISAGLVENAMIRRGLYDGEFDGSIADTEQYIGALADCLYSLVTAVSFSESDKSIGSLSSSDKALILKRANKLYAQIGEEEKPTDEPMVYVGDCL